MFVSSSDSALDRWENNGYEYAVGVDTDPACPAGDWVTGYNAARRGNADGSWFGNTEIVNVQDDAAICRGSADYNGYTFEALARTQEEADMIAVAFAHWAEGDVYAVERDSATGGSDSIGGIYTADGVAPSREEVEKWDW